MEAHAAQLLPVISGTVEEALLRWLRAAELTCDRAALLVAQVNLASTSFDDRRGYNHERFLHKQDRECGQYVLLTNS